MIKKIETSLKILKQPCVMVEANEDISQIITDLKDTLLHYGKRCWGLSANQIGYNKKISYIRVPKKMNTQTKEIEYTELLLINPKIIEKETKIKVKQEACLSFSGLLVDTFRYVFMTVEFENNKRELQTVMFQDLESICIMHEIDHLNGRTIFDAKWRATN